MKKTRSTSHKVSPAAAAASLSANPLTASGTDADVFIQAGHQNTPDGKTGGEGKLGSKEIEWTPVVADEATRILRAAGVSVIREDASIKRPERRNERFRCAVAVFLHFDDSDSGTSGASVGYDHDSDKPAATAWKQLYSKFWPFKWEDDNFTADERGYYGYKYTITSDGEFLIEFGDLESLAQARWMKPRLRWMGALLAHFLSQRVGKGNVPLPAFPADNTVADPHSEADEHLEALHFTSPTGGLPKRLPDYAREKLSAEAGIPWDKAGARPQFNGYKGLMADSLYLFSNLQDMPAAGVTSAVFYESKFAIDSDGSSGAGDITHQGKTSLRHEDGSSLDARTDLFAVLPMDAAQAKKEGLRKLPGLPDFGSLGLRLGDVGVAFWGSEMTVFAYGDEGPPNSLGEGSIAMAKALKIPSDPSSGGFNDKDLHDMGKGVIHLVFPGSRDVADSGQPRTQRTPEDIEKLALSLFEAFRRQHG